MLPLLLRRKNCATIFIVSTCLFYFMWLFHLKTNTNSSQYEFSNNHDLHLNLKKQIFLIKTTSPQIQTTKTQTILNDENKEFKENKEFIIDNQHIEKLNGLLKYLHDNKAFLLQVDVLREILIDNKRLSYDLLKKYSNSPNSLALTFGIHEDYLPKLISKKQIDTLDAECEVKMSKITHLSDNYESTVIITCFSIQIQLSVLHKRGDFFWIPQDNDPEFKNIKWFGDEARGVNLFNIRELSIDSNKIYIPAKLDEFLFDYESSKFLECNRELAYENLNNLGSNYTQDLKKNKMLQPVLGHISKTLEKLRKHYWLAGGTLLGWYRDCGIIPHTQDVDFAIWAHEYDTSIKKAFLGNSIVRIWGTLGMLNDSFEFRMYNDKFTFDLFLTYKLNETIQWCGYQVNRLKYRRYLPNFDKLCSAELLNNKLYVPCDPVAYLNKEYGRPDRWKTPKEKNYTWSNVVFNSKWTDEQWPHVIKFYDKSGNLLKKKTLEVVNKELKHNLTDIDGLDNDD